jgi:cell division protein FtsB
MAKAPAHLHLNPKQMALVGGIVIVGLFLFGYTSRLIASSEAQSEVAQWQQEVDLAQQRLAENQARLEYAKTDAYVIEKAHSDLGWAFPDEIAVWVVGDEKPPVEATAAGVEQAPYWQQWRNRFFGP